MKHNQQKIRKACEYLAESHNAELTLTVSALDLYSASKKFL